MIRYLFIVVIVCVASFALAQEEMLEKLGVAFIQERDGEEFVFLRMAPSQWRLARARAKLFAADKVSFDLNARQMAALRSLFDEAHEWSDITVEVSGARVKELKGLKCHYLLLSPDALWRSNHKRQKRLDIQATIEESATEIEKMLDKVTYRYQRQPVPPWEVKPEEYLLLTNAQIVDVDKGKLRQERAVLIRQQRIERLLLADQLAQVRQNCTIKKEIDLQGNYLIPGLSDIHCHPTLISEFGMGPFDMKCFDGQRMKSSEEALKSGCTFVRDCGGAFPKVSMLKKEIAADRLLGPKIMSCNGAISPKGGMWDVGAIKNRLGHVIFGGKLLWFASSDSDVIDAIREIQETGNDFFKFYFEEKPLYGGKESSVYNMFTAEQARLIRSQADKYHKQAAAHAMFMKGVHLLIDARFDTIEHLTCDVAYSPADAEKMKKHGVAIVPTVSLGGYLSMECAGKGYHDNAEVVYFQKLRAETYEQEVARYVIPELHKNYNKFFVWLAKPMEERSMPMVGQVYPERVHNFARLAPQSLANFRRAGTRVGVGTDGGNGITFCGNVAKEMMLLCRYGYSPAEVLRMATLGNMEIVGMDKELGAIETGKYADLVVLSANPLVDVRAAVQVVCVFKNGRLYHRQ